jgi:alpha-N-acetylglucosaminidase
MKRFLFVGSLLLALIPAAARCRTAGEKAAEGLARRIVPAYAGRIRFVQAPQEEEGYTFYSEGKKLIIKGNDALSMAVGLNRYLHDYCLTTVSWYASDAVDVPARMPAVPAPVSGSARVRDRFFLNYCTFGYTMPWWKWEDWERMIDWMALQGINMPLAITGQEAVWQKVWRQYGLSDEEIRAYFTGPAHLPWHRMNNIDHFDGPLPQGWLDGQVKLQQQILARERELGMRPVLPAFAGHVPGELQKLYPEAQISRLSRWGGFPDSDRCHFLSSADPLYARIQKAFLEEQTRLFGTDHLYGFDLFNEVEAPSWDPETLAEISRKAYGSVAAVDPDAVWIQMGWLFHYDRKHWQPEIMKAYLQAVPEGRVVILDYYLEHTPVWKNSESFYGQPFILCYLGNFGGNTRFAGDFREIGRRMEEGLATGGATGFGSTLEGFGINQAVYEYVLEKAWDTSCEDSAWIEALADRHLGRKDDAWRQAWKALADSVYVGGLGTQTTLVCGRPSRGGARKWTGNFTIRYDNATLVRIWKQMLAVPPGNGTAALDVVTVGSQALGNHFVTLRDAFIERIDARDADGAEALAGRMQALIRDLDALLACEPQFRLDGWTGAAEGWGRTPEEQAYYRRNARRIITTWGRITSLQDYASRQWSGLLTSFYAGRWKMFTDGMIAALREGKDFDDKAFMGRISDFENAWVEEEAPFACPAPADPYALSRTLIDKYGL